MCVCVFVCLCLCCQSPLISKYIVLVLVFVFLDTRYEGGEVYLNFKPQTELKRGNPHFTSDLSSSHDQVNANFLQIMFHWTRNFQIEVPELVTLLTVQITVNNRVGRGWVISVIWFVKRILISSGFHTRSALLLLLLRREYCYEIFIAYVIKLAGTVVASRGRGSGHAFKTRNSQLAATSHASVCKSLENRQNAKQCQTITTLYTPL